jgi:hypothetical protein
MRLFMGVIVGVVMTIGIAFVADSFVTADIAGESTSRQMVNWDVAKERLHGFTATVRAGWSRLERGVNRLT